MSEVWMLVKDREKLATLMALAGLTTRDLAACAGWRSHTYVLRILSGNVRSLRPEPAVRIAERLGVNVDELFVPRVTKNAGHNDQAAA